MEYVAPFKVVVLGAVGTGKSTFVQTANPDDAIHTEQFATDSAVNLKLMTTVALDFARVSLENHKVCQVYGLPGQDRFDFMADIVIPHADVCLLLVAAHRPQTWLQAGELLQRLDQYGDRQPHIPSPLRVVIGLTHHDCCSTLSLDQVEQTLVQAVGDRALPLLIVDPRSAASVRQTLMALLPPLALER